MTTLYDLLSAPEIDMDEVRAHLDGLPEKRRVAEIRAIGLRGQRRLFRAAEGFKKVSLSDFVPEDAPTGRYVRHFGKSSRAVFPEFEGRFARPLGGAKEYWGYSLLDPLLMSAVGPGHFVVRAADGDGEVLLDYGRVPPVAIDGAPEVKSNRFGLAFFVYGNTADVVRGVSEHVTVARTHKRGEPTESYRLLCREER